MAQQGGAIPLWDKEASATHAQLLGRTRVLAGRSIQPHLHPLAGADPTCPALLTAGLPSCTVEGSQHLPAASLGPPQSLLRAWFHQGQQGRDGLGAAGAARPALAPGCLKGCMSCTRLAAHVQQLQMGLHMAQASEGHLNVAVAAAPPANEVLCQALDSCSEAAGLI